ncbi:hypothetical protein ACJRO7_001843 [Eucalyptus globulus]|uniref:Uncharacterized protein n=1 Tax=Eucalyptus globulus TaxID=34317 RepID=A0ABD3LSC6_EUCGL
MDPVTLLRRKFHAYRMAQDAKQERQEYHDSYMTAITNLNLSMQLIRQEELLVLGSITEARAFVGLWPQFLANRGNLNRVHIGNMSNGSRAVVRRWLEGRGFIPKQTNLVFLVPAK